MCKALYTYSVILVIILSIRVASAQIEEHPYPSGYTVNLNHLNGSILQHSERMAHLTDQKPQAIELDINKQTYGQRGWQQIYNFPQFGAAVHYIRVNPEKPLGDMVSITPYFSPTIYRTPGLLINYRIGAGAAYINKVFHPENNPENILISSRLNFSLYGNINIRKYLYSNLHVNLGVGIMHYSNGSSKTPNLGINIPTLHVGLGFGTQPQRGFQKDSLLYYKKRFHINLLGNYGLKETANPGGAKYMNLSSCLFISKMLNRKSLITAGIDVFYNGTYTQHLNNPDPENLNYLISSGITLGHELMVARLSLLTQMGFYVYDPLTPATPVYQRYYLRYFLSKNMSIGVGLKTHYGNADFVEWGLGLRL